MKHKLWRRIKALLFPPRCAGCGTLLDGDASAGLCPICHANFLHTENFGCPLRNRPDLNCRCLPRYSSRYVRAYLHTCAYLPGVITGIVLSLKRRQNADAATLCAQRMADALQKDCAARGISASSLLLIPLAPSERSRRTGIDSAYSLAKALKKQCGATVFRALRRTYGADEQKKLHGAQRLENAKKTYRLRPFVKQRIRGRDIVLVDDILTTGASCRACAALLHAAGARSITVLTFGKTYLYRKGALC